jgi:uncharacterized protein YuzE
VIVIGKNVRAARYIFPFTSAISAWNGREWDNAKTCDQIVRVNENEMGKIVGLEIPGNILTGIKKIKKYLKKKSKSSIYLTRRCR